MSKAQPTATELLQKLLPAFVSEFPSASKAARQLRISTGTISYLQNGKWDKVSIEMIENIVAAIHRWNQLKTVSPEMFADFKRLFVYMDVKDLKEDLLDHAMNEHLDPDLRKLLKEVFLAVDETSLKLTSHD